MIFGVIAALALFAAMDLPRLIREQNRRALIVYWACLAIVAVYMAVYACGIRWMSSNEALHRFAGYGLGVRYK